MFRDCLQYQSQEFRLLDVMPDYTCKNSILCSYFETGGNSRASRSINDAVMPPATNTAWKAIENLFPIRKQ
jgi:hypothetical protein